MKKVTTITLCVLGLTTLQVAWDWLRWNRQLTRLNLMIWLGFLALLGGYYLLLRCEPIADPLKRLHRWVYSQLTGRRVVGLALLFFGAYAAWYSQHVWGKLLVHNEFGAIFYRYALLDQIFPRLIAYNPLLNGGYQTIELLATAPSNLFLLTYPIRALFSLETAFKVQPLLLVVLLPSLIYLSGRLIEFSHEEAFLAAAFSLVMTPTGHEGLMSFLLDGTLPHLFSDGLAVVVFALSYRVAVLGKSAAWGIPLLVLLTSLGAFHAYFAVTLGPVALAVVLFGTLPRKQRIMYAALVMVSLLVIQSRLLYELLSYSGGDVLRAEIAHSWLPFREWLGKLEKNFLGLRVVLVSMAIVGLKDLLGSNGESSKRRLGGLLLVAIVYTSLLVAMLYYVEARLQPFLFVVPLSFFLSLALGPAWAVLRPLWTRMEREASASAFVLNAALLLLTVFLWLSHFVYFSAFPTAPPETYRLVEWLREDTGEDGRVFVYGPLHNTVLGDAAFYQAATKRPMMGVTPFINHGWVRAIHRCLGDAEAASGCRELYNIRYVVTFSGEDGSAVLTSPEAWLAKGFRLAKTIGKIRIYQSEQPGSYFLVGQGQVQQQLNRIAVTAEPSEFMVLKFFWAPGLRTDPPLALEPYPLPNGRAFIKVRSNYHDHFDILYQPF